MGNQNPSIEKRPNDGKKKGRRMIYNTLHRKLKIEHREPH